MLRRRFADLLLFCVTLTELVILFRLTPTFGVADWIYVLQHLMVLAIALARPRPQVRDYSMPTSIAVAVSYAYPYAQVIYLRWSPGEEAWPAGGLALVTLAAGLSFLSLLAIRRRFGVRPALRGLATSGPYRFVRHPMYLSYILTVGSISSSDPVGRTFEAKLDQDVAVKGNVLLKAGTKAFGRIKSSRANPRNSEPLSLELTSISVNGSNVAVKTNSVQPTGRPSTARGARHGVTVGTLRVSPGTKMQFQLAQAVTL